MNRSGVITILILACIIALVFSFYWQVQQKNTQETLETSPAADVLLREGNYYDIDGNSVTLNDYLGETVIAFSWASWCPACIDQLKLFGEVASENQTVKVLAFNRGESASTAKDFLEFYNLDTNFQLVLDPADHFFDSIEGYSMPETVIFDLDGNIFHHQRNTITKEELEYLLAEVEKKFPSE